VSGSIEERRNGFGLRKIAKITGGVEIKRGTVNVPHLLLVRAQACSSLLAPTCPSQPSYNDKAHTAILAPETLKVITLIVSVNNP
jgi:hypothetical protein